MSLGVSATVLVCAFHTQIVPSLEPETMCVLLGENATDLTQFVCPLKGPAMVLPVCGFNTRMVWS